MEKDRKSSNNGLFLNWWHNEKSEVVCDYQCIDVRLLRYTEFIIGFLEIKNFWFFKTLSRNLAEIVIRKTDK